MLSGVAYKVANSAFTNRVRPSAERIRSPLRFVVLYRARSISGKLRSHSTLGCAFFSVVNVSIPSPGTMSRLLSVVMFTLLASVSAFSLAVITLFRLLFASSANVTLSPPSRSRISTGFSKLSSCAGSIPYSPTLFRRYS